MILALEKPLTITFFAGFPMEKAGTGGIVRTKLQRARSKFQRFGCRRQMELMNETGTCLAWLVLRMPREKALRLEGSTVPGTIEHMHVFLQSTMVFKLGCGHSAPILLTGTPSLGSHSITWAASRPRPRPAPTAHLFVPDLQGLAADAVEDGKEATLERVLEHLASRGPAAAALGPGLEIGTEGEREWVPPVRREDDESCSH